MTPPERSSSAAALKPGQKWKHMSTGVVVRITLVHRGRVLWTIGHHAGKDSLESFISRFSPVGA